MSRSIALLCAAASAALLTSELSAATIFWQGAGVSGNLTDSNYSDGTNPNLAPTAADVVNFGGGGTATHSVAGITSFLKLRVAHNQAPGGTGTGIVTVNNGAQINLTGGAAGSEDAGLWVGNAQNGTLNIDGAGSSVTSNQLIVIGYASNQPSRNGTVNITNGGSLISSAGNINMGDSASAGQNGIQGHLFVSGTGSTVSAMGTGADLNIGIRTAQSSVTQTGGTIDIADAIEVGFGGTGTHTNSNSSFNLSGGTTTHGGNFFLGRGASAGATVNLSGTGTLNTGNRFLMGSGTATGVVMNHSGGTLNTTLDVRVGDAGTTAHSTYNLSGTGVINSTTGGIVGRQGTGRFFQTGGTANFNGALSIGNREAAANATSGLYEISGGDLNVTTALDVAPKGVGEFRVIGDDATIDVTGNFSLGNTVDGLGTLAFALETGDLLSLVNVTGTATFDAASSLVFDASNAAPTQTIYDLLTATTITDNGIAFTGPAGWSYQIVPGGNGQILQVVVPEPASFGLIALTGFLALRRRRRA